MSATPSALLDLALLVILASQAIRGARTGLVLGAFGLVGTVCGMLAGVWIAPRVLAHFPEASNLVRTFAILAAGWIGSQIGSNLALRAGARIRPSRPGSRTRRLDATLGAAATTLVTALVMWFIGSAVRPVVPVSWGRVINDSAVLAKTDQLVPAQARSLPGRFTAAIDDVFPRVFSGLTPEPSLPVEAPDASVANSSAIQAVKNSVVKVTTNAPRCNASFVGSGWVVVGERVVTNAHVVAGSSSVSVQVGTSMVRHEARVVAFDPDLDLAILAVDNLDAPALKRAAAVERGTSTVVAGYPLGGAYTLAASRVRGVVDANGDDIYGGSGVHREVYSLRTTLEHGNSGGPLLTRSGRVAGTVFAKSMADGTTGYALTDDATDSMLDRAAQLTSSVSTQGCAEG